MKAIIWGSTIGAYPELYAVAKKLASDIISVATVILHLSRHVL